MVRGGHDDNAVDGYGSSSGDCDDADDAAGAADDAAAVDDDDGDDMCFSWMNASHVRQASLPGPGGILRLRLCRAYDGLRLFGRGARGPEAGQLLALPGVPSLAAWLAKAVCPHGRMQIMMSSC